MKNILLKTDGERYPKAKQKSLLEYASS